jgi:hypothetical protein
MPPARLVASLQRPDAALFQDYVGLEESANRIQTFGVQFVPGLMQTRAYARAVISRGLPAAPADEVARRVAQRMQRQRLVTQPQAPRLWVAVGEAVLHHQVGGPVVLRNSWRTCWN